MATISRASPCRAAVSVRGLDKLVSASPAATNDKGFRAQFPTLPHESTADQFFNEAEFEAYRELGYRLARTAIGGVRKLQRLEPVRSLSGL